MKIVSIFAILVAGILVGVFFAFITTENQPDIQPPYRSEIFRRCVDGKNCIFEYYPTDKAEDIVDEMNRIVALQGGENRAWGNYSFALLFHKGVYDFKGKYLPVHFFTSVRGLGNNPGDVVFKNCKLGIAGNAKGRKVTNQFWRDVENITVMGDIDWFTSQACPLRRIVAFGKVALDAGGKGWSSGGFLGNVQSENISSSTQQQFCFKNIETKTNSMGRNFNYVFVNSITQFNGKGCNEGWTLNNEVKVRDKPFLIESGNILVPGWTSETGVVFATSTDKIIYYPDVYTAYPDTDTPDTINKAIRQGKKALIMTAGQYAFDKPVQISSDGFVVLGVGWPIISVENQNTGFEITGSNCYISGVMLDTSTVPSKSLLHFGGTGKGGFAHDVFCRMLTPLNGAISKCESMMVVDKDNAYLENIWLWVADHQGTGTTDWGRMDNPNGITINGNGVTAVGLAVEHQRDIMTLWNGRNGKCYFYQSEFPYNNPISQGKASYTVNGDDHLIVGGGAYFVVWPSTQSLNLSAFSLPKSARYVSITGSNWPPNNPTLNGLSHTLNGIGPLGRVGC